MIQFASPTTSRTVLAVLGKRLRSARHALAHLTGTNLGSPVAIRKAEDSRVFVAFRCDCGELTVLTFPRADL